MIDKIVIGWKIGMNLIGQLSDEQLEKDLKGIDKDAKRRERFTKLRFLAAGAAALKATVSLDRALNKSLTSAKEEDEGLGVPALPTDGVLGAPGAPGAEIGAPAGTKITSAAPKVFNINIATLVENINNNVTNLREGMNESKKIVVEALLSSLSDTQSSIR